VSSSRKWSVRIPAPNGKKRGDAGQITRDIIERGSGRDLGSQQLAIANDLAESIESWYVFGNLPSALDPATLPPDSLQIVDTIGTPYTLPETTSVCSAKTGPIERRPVSVK
jgi:hypothetical protein